MRNHVDIAYSWFLSLFPSLYVYKQRVRYVQNLACESDFMIFNLSLLPSIFRVQGKARACRRMALQWQIVPPNSRTSCTFQNTYIE